MMNHSHCSHPATKSERAKCRKRHNAEKPLPHQTAARDRQLAELDELRKTAPQRARESARNATVADREEYRRLVAEIESRETDTLSDVQSDIEKLRDVTGKMF